MSTLKEIASKVNVSITTVSRVLNHDTSLSVGEDIRSKIEKTAIKMNYKTPRNRLRLKSSNKLSIAIINWYNFSEVTDDPYYMQIRRGIEQLSIKSNINTSVIYKTNGEFILETIEDVQGIICIGKFSRKDISRFEKISKNLVFVDSSPNEKVFDSVVIDSHTAVTDILSHLVLKGYKKIGYFGGIEYISKSVKLGGKRELIFRDYLYKKALLDTSLIHVGKFTSESGYKLMKEALKGKKRAEVYFCASDLIAIGAIRAVHEIGLSIPKDIGVIGFNDIQSSKYTYPPLSTLHVYSEFMGEQALGLLIERIEGRQIAIKKTIPTKLVVRKTIK